jgi:hypothetical protein
MALCKKCGRPISFYESQCECGEFDSFPNVRAAREQLGFLIARYNQARAMAYTNDTNGMLDAVERLADAAAAVVNMSVRAADNVMRDDKYRNYYQSLSAGMRLAAERVHHAERGKVDATMFPEYFPHIVSMALSPNERGLTSYGEVTMVVNDIEYLQLRGSLLERNTYMFYDEHDMGGRKAVEPPGFRADWHARGLLAAAKLQKKINGSSTLDEASKAFLLDSGDREKDEFIEIHVFAPGGIARKYFARVRLQTNLTEEDDRDRWRLVHKSGNKIGIAVVG